MLWKACGCPTWARCQHAAIERDRRRALARLAAVDRKINAAVERGNRRRRLCLEKVLERLMRGDPTGARIWLTKLASAGFNREDAAAMEAMDPIALEREVRGLLNI